MALEMARFSAIKFRLVLFLGFCEKLEQRQTNQRQEILRSNEYTRCCISVKCFTRNLSYNGWLRIENDPKIWNFIVGINSFHANVLNMTILKTFCFVSANDRNYAEWKVVETRYANGKCTRQVKTRETLLKFDSINF